MIILKKILKFILKALLTVIGIIIVFYILLQINAHMIINKWYDESAKSISDLESILASDDMSKIDVNVVIHDYEIDTNIVLLKYFKYFQEDSVRIEVYLDAKEPEGVNMQAVINARKKIIEYIEGSDKSIFFLKANIRLDIYIAPPQGSHHVYLNTYFYNKYENNKSIPDIEHPEITNTLFTAVEIRQGRINVSDMKDFTDIRLFYSGESFLENLETDHDFSCFPDLKYLSISGLDDDPELEAQIRATLPKGCKLYSHGKYS